jgi:hypothetical protein
MKHRGTNVALMGFLGILLRKARKSVKHYRSGAEG